MKIALFGATGKTGRLVLDCFLSQGHVVTALVRTPAKIDIQFIAHKHMAVIVLSSPSYIFLRLSHVHYKRA